MLAFWTSVTVFYRKNFYIAIVIFDLRSNTWEQVQLNCLFKRINERNDGLFTVNDWIPVSKMYFQEPEKVQSNNVDSRTYVMRLGDIASEGHPNNKFKFGRFVLNDIGDGVVSELFPIYRPIFNGVQSYWKIDIQIERIMAPIFSKSITSSGNSANKLNEKHFSRQVICMPNAEEQQRIGTFFEQLDNLITLQQSKLDSLK